MAHRRVIDVRKQTKLPLSKCVKLVLSGIAHRLLRSTLTMSVILLAVAFFMAMLSESMFIHATAQRVTADVDALREAPQLLSFLFSKPSNLLISENLADMHATDPDGLKEYATVSGWDAGRLAKLAEICHWEQTYLRFFDGMGIGKRLILVGKNTGRGIFQHLQGPTELDGFFEAMRPLRALRLPTDEAVFRSFIGAYRDFRRDLGEFETAWAAALRRFAARSKALTGTTKLEDWLCDATADQLVQWRGAATEAGFGLSSGKLMRVVEYLRKLRLRNEIASVLNTPEKKEKWKHVYQERMSLDRKLLRLTDHRVPEILDNAYTPEDLAAVSQLFAHEQRLMHLEHKLAGKTATDTGAVLSGRQVFLLFISFMVCMVGIANAMLMAITERFREIATMKCLGATDGYILTQFMMEASLQGVAGGLLGMVIGLLLALLKTGFVYRAHLFTNFPFGGVAGSGFLSILAGVVLAALASLYPSWAASRMAPMEAMRVE